MWHETLQDFKKNNKQFLDFKFDLHVTIFIISILKDTIKFTITKNKTKESLTITYYDEEKQKKLSNDMFFYWWQIDRHDELLSEEFVVVLESGLFFLVLVFSVLFSVSFLFFDDDSVVEVLLFLA